MYVLFPSPKRDAPRSNVRIVQQSVLYYSPLCSFIGLFNCRLFPFFQPDRSSKAVVGPFLHNWLERQFFTTAFYAQRLDASSPWVASGWGNYAPFLSVSQGTETHTPSPEKTKTDRQTDVEVYTTSSKKHKHQAILDKANEKTNSPPQRGVAYVLPLPISGNVPPPLTANQCECFKHKIKPEQQLGYKDCSPWEAFMYGQTLILT